MKGHLITTFGVFGGPERELDHPEKITFVDRRRDQSSKKQGKRNETIYDPGVFRKRTYRAKN